AVWLCIDGVRHGGDHGAVVPGVAASLFHDGLGRQRQFVLWHHHDDHLHSHGGEDLQLAVHHVSRPGGIRTADDVDRRLHDYLRHWRYDGRTARGSTCGFLAAQ